MPNATRLIDKITELSDFSGTLIEGGFVKYEGGYFYISIPQVSDISDAGSMALENVNDYYTSDEVDQLISQGIGEIDFTPYAHLSGATFTGNITAPNLSGNNTGDQDLTPYALKSGAIFTGAISATNFSGSSSGVNTGDQNLAPYALLAGATFTGPITATNLTGTNTGDQDLSGYALSSSLNNYALKSGTTFTGAISATNLTGTNTGDQNLAPYALLAGATFTGAISATNFSGSSSGTNTGDQDLSGYALSSSLNNYALKTGANFTGAITATNLSGNNTGDQDLSGLASLSGASFTGPISATNLTGTNTGDQSLTHLAPLASPALTGTPTAPTATLGTNTTQIANAAFVRNEISALIASAPGTLDTLNELATALGNDPNFATTITNSLAGKQPLDSTLTALAGISTSADQLIYTTGTDVFATTPISSFVRTVLDDADAATFLGTIGGASNASVVHNTGDETIAGIKSFSGAINANGGAVVPSGQAIDLYNTADQTTNYERLRLDWSTNVARLRTSVGGTGTNRSLQIGTNAANFTIGTGSFPNYAATVGSTGNVGNMFQIGGTSTAASGTYNGLALVNNYAGQTGTAAYNSLSIQDTTTGRTASGSGFGILYAVDGANLFSVSNAGSLRAATYLPQTSTSTLNLNTTPYSAAGTAINAATGSMSNAAGIVNGLLVNPTDATTGTGGVYGIVAKISGTGTGSGSKFPFVVQNASGTNTMQVDQSGTMYSGALVTVSGDTTLQLQTRNFANSGNMVDAAKGTFTNSSGQGVGLRVAPTFNQTATAGGVGILLDETRTAAGSGTNLGFQYKVGGSQVAGIDSSGLATFNGGVTVGSSSTLVSRFLSPASGDSTLNLQVRNFTAAGDAVLMATGTATNSAGQYNAVRIAPTYNQTGTGGGNVLNLDFTETAIGSSGLNAIGINRNASQVARITNFGTYVGPGITALATNGPLGVQTQNFNAAGNAVNMATGSMSNASGTVVGVNVNPTDATTGTGGVYGIVSKISGTGTGSGGKFNYVGQDSSGTNTFSVSPSGTLTANVAVVSQIQRAANATLVVGQQSSNTALNLVDAATGTFTHSTGTGVGLAVRPTNSTTGTGAVIPLLIDLLGSGTGSGGTTLADFRLAGTSKHVFGTTGNYTAAGYVRAGGGFNNNGNVGVSGTFLSPTSITVSGGIITAATGNTVVTITSTYSILSTDRVILADATTTGFTVTLPTAVGTSGVEYTIKKKDATANVVTIATASSQTIDGSTTASISTPNTAITVISDGSNWYII